jgi:hypothetical protein
MTTDITPLLILIAGVIIFFIGTLVSRTSRTMSGKISFLKGKWFWIVVLIVAIFVWRNYKSSVKESYVPPPLPKTNIDGGVNSSSSEKSAEEKEWPSEGKMNISVQIPVQATLDPRRTYTSYSGAGAIYVFVKDSVNWTFYDTSGVYETSPKWQKFPYGRYKIYSWKTENATFEWWRGQRN